MHQEDKSTVTRNNHKKTKATFSRLLRHPSSNGKALFLFWRFINLSLT